MSRYVLVVVVVVLLVGGGVAAEPLLVAEQATIRSYNVNGTLITGWLPTADRFAFGLRLGFGMRVSPRVEVGIAGEFYATNRARTIGAPARRSLSLEGEISESSESSPSETESSSSDSTIGSGEQTSSGQGSGDEVVSLPELTATPRVCGRYYLAPLTASVVPYFELGGGAMFSHEGTAALASGTLGYLLWRRSRITSYIEVSYRWLYGLAAAEIWGERGSHHELHLGVGVSLWTR